MEDLSYDWVPVNSSNVVAMRFDQPGLFMDVAFGDGVYRYFNVSISEAYTALGARSKGGFIWDYFRVRGSRTRHKKPYVKIG